MPWKKVAAAIVWTAKNAPDVWNRLDPEERTELLALVKKSKGRWSSLSDKEQARARELVGKLRKKLPPEE